MMETRAEVSHGYSKCVRSIAWICVHQKSERMVHRDGRGVYHPGDLCHCGTRPGRFGGGLFGGLAVDFCRRCALAGDVQRRWGRTGDLAADSRSYLHPWRNLLSDTSIAGAGHADAAAGWNRSEEHTSELQSRFDLVCRLLL